MSEPADESDREKIGTERNESRPDRAGRRADNERRQARTPLSPREIWRLIAATYRTTLPYLIVLIAGLLLATWLLTELVF